MSKQAEESGPLIEEKLLQAWREEQRFFHLRGLARFLIWLVAMVLIDLVIDWQIFFRSRWETPGILLLVLNAMVLFWVLWREWFRHLKSFDSFRVSLEVEKKHPELRSVLVSYTQLKDFDAEEAKASPALLDAMRKQAISLTRPLDFREVVDFRQLTNIALVSLASIGIFVAVTFEWQEQMSLLFKRLLGENLEYPTETIILSTSPSITIKKGDTVKIVTMVDSRGVIPESGTLFVHLESGEEKSIEKRGNGNEFTWEMEKVSENRDYYVEVGDDRSEHYRIVVSPEPQITQTNVLLTYPEYLDRNASRENTLKLVVPQGTRIKWALQCHPPMRAVKVTLGDEKLDANVSADGTEAVFETLAEETFKYTFHWTEKGHGFEYDDLQHLVRVEPDRIPDVELVEPSSNGVATVNKVLQLVARAMDDHQLGEATLLYSINGGEEKRFAIGKLSGTQKEIRYRWPLNELLKEEGKLEPSDKITFSIEVSDRRPPLGTHINLSATRRLTILSQEQYLAWFKGELDAQREIIVKARDSEKRATTEVSKLKAEEKKE
ncbi:MAG: hypothetical protein VCA36_03520 [Opitutales bacterium]